MNELKNLRESLGLSQQEISKKLNIAQTTYSGYETGRREPDLNTLVKLSNFFGTSIDYLVTGKKSNSVKMTNKQLEELQECINKLNILLSDLKKRNGVKDD